MKIRAYDETNNDAEGTHKEERRFLGLGSQIKIYNPSRNSRSIYATTIHELAHASHWNMWRKGNDFDNSDKIVKESWASGVEWSLTRMTYPTYERGYGRARYTGIVEDLIDGKETEFSYYSYEDGKFIYFPIEYRDVVEGYTIRQLEDALRGELKWVDWKNSIKNKYYNADENHLDLLFDVWATSK